MYTLGLNGWVSGVHDPAAAIFHNGEMVMAVEEERLCRSKHALDVLPTRAIRACLNAAKISAAEIDTVAVGWDVFHTIQYTSGIAVNATDRFMLDLFLPTALFPERKDKKIQFFSVPHHEAHATAAFIPSPFTKALVVVVDGSGEYDSTSLFIAERGQRPLNILALPFSESLGIFYQALTRFVGFGPFQEGKLMGLTAYGEPRYGIDRALDFSAQAQPRVPLSRDSEEVHIRRWQGIFERLTGKPPFNLFCSLNPGKTDLAQFSREQLDLAASGQRWLEEQLCSLVAYGMAKYDCSNIVIAGGVALNNPANSRVKQRFPHCKVYVPPSPGDAGVSIGAALSSLLAKGIDPSLDDRHVFSGPEYTTDEIGMILKKFGLSHKRVDDPAAVGADFIESEKTIGWFQGRMEFGPRALGNRSILALPTELRSHIRVNTLKLREPWRPLAPSVASECSYLWFDDVNDSPFMSFTGSVAPHKADRVPAVVHVDSTARVQTVPKDPAQPFWKLIDTLGKKTGVPIVLNTSFNIGGEPIVCTPVDAIRSFFSSELDRLVIGQFVVWK